MSNWRERSIVAQTAAKVAAELLASREFPTAQESSEYFRDWHKTIYESVMQLAGPVDEEYVPVSSLGLPPGSTYPSATSPAATSAGAPYTGTVRVPFGKFKGMTIAQIDNAVGQDGRTGHSWLQWASNGGIQDVVLVDQIRNYLASAGS